MKIQAKGLWDKRKLPYLSLTNICSNNELYSLGNNAFNIKSMSKRLKMLRQELKLTQEEFAHILGIGKSALCMIETNRSALSERNKNILIQQLNLNIDWLEGREPENGSMFNCPKDMIPYLRKSDRLVTSQSVPLYNIEGSAGLVPLFNDHNSVKPIDYINIPNLPKCDGAIYIVGDSMYPILKSGDIVLYKQLNNMENIFWGDMYLLSIDMEGEEYVTVKYIQKSQTPGRIKLVSQNQYHADKEIEIERIRALAYIKASIRMNSIR